MIRYTLETTICALCAIVLDTEDPPARPPLFTKRASLYKQLEFVLGELKKNDLLPDLKIL